MKPWRLKISSSIFLCVLLGVGSYLLVKDFSPFGLEFWRVERKILQIFYYPIIRRFQYSSFTVPFWAALALTLTLERLIPARPRQKIFSLNFAQDLIWFFYEGILQAFVVATYGALLMRGYETYFSGLTVASVNQLPEWAKFPFVLLLRDFLHWCQHYLNHKVPLFWELHKIHHSQKELNFFTDFRYHVLEYIVKQTFLLIPFLILGISLPTVVALAIFYSWYTRFYHGNIRTNLGPLRYILVTPQSHRVHHSVEARHRETNFGSLFCVWDFLFRTQYTGFDEYPQTGIEGHDFPHEESGGVKNLLFTPLLQMLYPLRIISGTGGSYFGR
jgi:sterol desaturase/sphingolipid hydroxylase (fatty acid hydroxylase superfamily)